MEGDGVEGEEAGVGVGEDEVIEGRTMQHDDEDDNWDEHYTRALPLIYSMCPKFRDLVTIQASEA